MKRQIILTLAIAFLTLTKSNKLFSQFSLTGEIRPRTEYRHGFKKLINENEDPAIFTEQRSRLIADFKQDKLVLRFSFQDVRIWGATDQIYKSDPALTAVNEAWGQYLFTKELSIKVGRQELDYDNARFLGNLAWAQQSRSHDALLFIYKDPTFQAHAGFAFNQDANTLEFGKLTSNFYSGVKNYKSMQFVWLNKTFGKNNVSFLFLNNGLQTGVKDTSSVSYGQTYGLYGNFQPGKFEVTAEAYYQGGKDAAKKDISAYLFSASLCYKALKKFKPAIGFDYLSGNSAGSTKNTAFNPLYGTNHKFYGFMDYFYVGNGHANVGLIDVFVKAGFPINNKFSFLTHLHSFMAPEKVINGAGTEYRSNLGTELDLVCNFNLSSNTNIKVGYSQMFASSSMEVLKGGKKDQTNNWAWLMITFKPTLIKSK